MCWLETSLLIFHQTDEPLCRIVSLRFVCSPLADRRGAPGACLRVRTRVLYVTACTFNAQMWHDYMNGSCLWAPAQTMRASAQRWVNFTSWIEKGGEVEFGWINPHLHPWFPGFVLARFFPPVLILGAGVANDLPGHSACHSGPTRRRMSSLPIRAAWWPQWGACCPPGSVKTLASFHCRESLRRRRHGDSAGERRKRARSSPALVCGD